MEMGSNRLNSWALKSEGPDSTLCFVTNRCGTFSNICLLPKFLDKIQKGGDGNSTSVSIKYDICNTLRITLTWDSRNVRYYWFLKFVAATAVCLIIMFSEPPELWLLIGIQTDLKEFSIHITQAVI